MKFLDWRKQTRRDCLGIVQGNDFGDWLAQEKTQTPLDYIDTVYFAIDARLMADMARASGRSEAAAEYEQLFEKIKRAFVKKYCMMTAPSRSTPKRPTPWPLTLI